MKEILMIQWPPENISVIQNNFCQTSSTMLKKAKGAGDELEASDWHLHITTYKRHVVPQQLSEKESTTGGD